MCGRYTLSHSPEEIKARFAIQQMLFTPNERYNIAPMQKVVVVTRNTHGDGSIDLEGYRWGLVPHWAKDDKIGSKMINARVETLTEKPSFRTALKKRRCLIPADGFYEWQAQGKTKQPMRIHFKDDRLYCFAGLWEEWKHDGETLRTCTIITGTPNSLVAHIHNRMPVILPREMQAIWI